MSAPESKADGWMNASLADRLREREREGGKWRDDDGERILNNKAPNPWTYKIKTNINHFHDNSRIYSFHSCDFTLTICNIL